MSTEVDYGGIKLSFVKTHSLECYPEMDPSGTDQTVNKFRYQCAAMFVREPGAGQGGETPAETYARIRHILTKPRQALKITVGGKVLLQAAGLDSQNGPKPLPGLTITQVTDEAFAVTWGVEVAAHDCGERGLFSPILSLRWVQTQDVDERNYSTFTTAGRMIAASDLLRGVPLDAFRPLCVPDQPPNTQRRARYTVQADGLAIDFAFTDTEKYQMPPEDSGVVDLDGELTKVITGGVVRFVQVSLMLEGRRDTPKRQLVATALGMALARLRAARPGGGRLFIKNGAVSEKLSRNAVRVQLEAYASDNAGTGGESDVSRLVRTGVDILTRTGVVIVGGSSVGITVDRATGRVPHKAEDADKVHAQVGIGLDGFGVRLQGCPDPVNEAPGIHPDLRGDYDRLLLIAAALRDGCMATLPRPVDHIQYEAHLRTPAMPKPNPDKKPADGRNRPPVLKPEPRRDIPASELQASASVTVETQLPPVESYFVVGVGEKYGGILTEYEVVLTYHNDRGGRDVLQATKSGYDGALVRVHNDGVALVADWTARKIGACPTVPAWTEPADGNAVCTKVTIAPERIDLAADGVTPVFTVTGSYVFKFKNAAKVKVQSPVPPWLDVPASVIPDYPADPSAIFRKESTSTLVSR